MNMLENKKFTMHKAPFIRKADHGENTTVMMRDFMIALAYLIIFAWVKNGLLPYIADKTNFFGMLYPLLLVLVGAASAFLFEFLWYYFIIKKGKSLDQPCEELSFNSGDSPRDDRSRLDAALARRDRSFLRHRRRQTPLRRLRK